MEYRIEHDSMGDMQVPADRLWAAQTQRSCQNFRIGVDIETRPREITHAFGILKKAAAQANHELKGEKMTAEKLVNNLTAHEKRDPTRQTNQQRLIKGKKETKLLLGQATS